MPDRTSCNRPFCRWGVPTLLVVWCVGCAMPGFSRSSQTASLPVEEALAVIDISPFAPQIFTEGQYAVSNGNLAFLLLTDLDPRSLTGHTSGGNTHQSNGTFHLADGKSLDYSVTHGLGQPNETATPGDGAAIIDGEEFSLANGSVFLLAQGKDGHEITQVSLAADYADPAQALIDLATGDTAVQAFLLETIRERLSSQNQDVRRDAALIAYQSRFAAQLPASELMEHLQADEPALRLMGASGLWERASRMTSEERRTTHTAHAVDVLADAAADEQFEESIRKLFVIELQRIAPEEPAAQQALEQMGKR